MNGATNEKLKNAAWQILTIGPTLKKRLVRPEIEQKNNPIPLSYVQVLAALNEKGSMSVSEISSRFDIAKPNITPLIDRLIEFGYAKRVRSMADRRIVHVVLLDEGRAKLDEVAESLAEAISGWSESLTDEKLDQLAGAIDTIRRILESK